MDKFPFPQANDFNKIVRLMTINNEEDLCDFEFISAFLDGITTRQVSYYLSACMYLGLLDRNKKFTSIGSEIRGLDSYSQIIELIRIVLSDPIIGKVYITEKVLNIKLDVSDIADMIKEKYTEYTEPLYKRRAQTVKSWLAWIEEQMS